MSSEHAYDIFISHASEDREIARPLAEGLQQWADFQSYRLSIGK